MSFSTPLFLALFFPLVWGAYWVLPRRPLVQNGVLLSASYLFFYSWGPQAFLVFLATTFVNYALLLQLRDRDDQGTPRQAGWVLPVGVAYNLGQLLLLKYVGFFASTVEGIAALFGGSLNLPTLSLLLPIGISFWTLQLTAYLIDVSYGRRQGPSDLLSYACFASFFPQVLSGPIARGDLLDQFEKPRSPELDAFSRGAFEFFLGYILCFLVGATLATVVNPVYGAPGTYTQGMHWLALFAYAQQIFCDFAGYSLMALGLGRLFGLRLIENFRFPFLARNMSDFWKRWHVSLTNILFDYIYTPLVTGSGWMRGRLAAGLFVVLLVSGLWHGATWMFVLWGALHGLVLVIAHRWDEFYRGLCRKNRQWVLRRKSRAYLTIAWFLTQGWFVFSLIPFRGANWETSSEFFCALFASTGELVMPPAGIAAQFNLLLCLLFVPAYHLTATARGTQLVALIMRTPAALRGVAYGMVVVYLFLMQPLAEGTFLYANF